MSRSVADTVEFGRRLGRGVRLDVAGPSIRVVSLVGDLGAGKTHLAKGLVAGLGGEADEVTSPTFTLLAVYETPTGEVHHLDCYRLSGPEEAADVGFEASLGDDPPTGTRRVVLIEWASRLPGLLPPETNRLEVTLAPGGPVGGPPASDVSAEGPAAWASTDSAINGRVLTVTGLRPQEATALSAD